VGLRTLRRELVVEGIAEGGIGGVRRGKEEGRDASEIVSECG